MENDELLIFKKRGISAGQDSAPPNMLGPGDKQEHDALALEKDLLPAVEKPDEIKIRQRAAPAANAAPAPAGPSKKESSAVEDARSAAYSEPLQEVPELAVSSEEASIAESIYEQAIEKPTEDKGNGAPSRLTRTAKENMQAAKGLKCSYHPWRPAYALCQYCERPFCYADLVKHKGNFYCLEDIDSVSTKEFAHEARTPANLFSRMAGAVFIANLVILGYFVYPSFLPLLSYAQSVGLQSFVFHLGSAYYTPLENNIILLLFFTGALAMLSGRNIGYYWSVLATLIALAAIGYEYVTSSDLFLFAVSAIALVNLAIMAYSRIGKNVKALEEVEERKEIDWPMPETF